MKKTLISAVVAAVAFAAPAMAWEGTTVACYDKVMVPAKYSYTKTLLKAGKKQYEHRHGRVELISYPPIYIQSKTLTSGAHFVMSEVSCGH